MAWFPGWPFRRNPARRHGHEGGTHLQAAEEPASEEEDTPRPDEQVVELPITDELDLHTFRPAETADVVRDYLDAAIAKGLREVRIVHGRGIGTQREIVRRVLARDPRVASFADAPVERGGWGATVAELSADVGPAGER
jgi:dsDNA-specific endonuclease/ATPase MutS2